MYRTSLLVSLLLAVACGGSTPPAEAPEGSEAPAKKSAKKDSDDSADKADAEKSGDSDADKDGDKKDDKDSKKSDAKKDDKKDEKSDDSGSKSGRSPRDILAAPDVVWVLNFNDSDVKGAAEEKCEGKSGKDPKKMNACMAAAHKAVDVDGYRFVEKDDKLWWVTLKINGKKITNLHKFEIDMVEKDHAAVVKPKGKDLGQAPGRTPADVTFDVPNEYQITVKDPKFGKLAYDAKIGLVSNDEGGGTAGKAKR
jgi:hypothetical protein